MIAQRLRSLGIGWTCSAMNWTYEIFFCEETLWTRLGRWIDAQLHRVFGFLYDGSDQEIDDALDGTIPRRHMSGRQRQAGADALISGEPQWPFFFDEFCCADCDAALLIVDETNLCAECRALHPEMLLEDRKSLSVPL